MDKMEKEKTVDLSKELNQNDRIEYLLKLRFLKDNLYKIDLTFSFLCIIFAIVSLIATAVIGAIGFFGKQMELIYLANAFAFFWNFGLFFGFLMMITEIIMYVVSIYKFKKNLSKLNSEFFSFEIKPKKSNKNNIKNSKIKNKRKR